MVLNAATRTGSRTGSDVRRGQPRRTATTQQVALPDVLCVGPNGPCTGVP